MKNCIRKCRIICLFFAALFSTCATHIHSDRLSHTLAYINICKYFFYSYSFLFMIQHNFVMEHVDDSFHISSVSGVCSSYRSGDEELAELFVLNSQRKIDRMLSQNAHSYFRISEWLAKMVFFVQHLEIIVLVNYCLIILILIRY